MTDAFFKESYFYGGCILSDDRLVLLCRQNYDADDAMSVALFVDKNIIHKLELPGDFYVGVASIGDRVVFVAQMGSTVIVDAPANTSWGDLVGSRVDQRINDTDDFGELTKIRTFDSTFWVCGQFGQLYKLSNSSWDRADGGLRSLEAPDFEDIGGKSKIDIVGGGLFGEMHRYDGKTWKKVDLPTNQNISAIIVSNDGKYYVAGYNGLVLVGERDLWDIIGDLTPERHYEDLAFHDGELFFLHSKGIDKVIADAIEPIEDSFGDGTTLRKFAWGHERLVVICEDRLFEHTNGKWNALQLPIIP